MNHFGTDTRHQFQDDQTATDHDYHSDIKPPLHSASNPVAYDGCLSAAHSAAGGNTRDGADIARARQIHMHGGALRRWGRVPPSFSTADAVLRHLTHHIGISIPAGLRTSPAILPRFWFSVHNKVAVSALHQAQRKVHQLGLTRVEDTKGFLAEHCRWYGLFCSFSQVVTSLFSPPHKELI